MGKRPTRHISLHLAEIYEFLLEETEVPITKNHYLG